MILFAPDEVELPGFPLRVPLRPEIGGPEVLNAFCADDTDAGRRLVGMDRKKRDVVVADLFREEREGLAVKGREEVPFGEVFAVTGDGERGPDIVRGKRVAAERGVGEVRDAVDDGGARVFAAEGFPALRRLFRTWRVRSKCVPSSLSAMPIVLCPAKGAMSAAGFASAR
jgi:hypothetical protein